jgi:eukaryotic-like serine/threonine-protein kinase
VRFTVKTDGPIRSTPVVSGGRLYFGSSDGVFRAIDARTGEARWQLRTKGAITSSPAVDDRRAYFVSRDGALYAVFVRDGKVAWKHEFGADVGPYDFWDYNLSSPRLANGALIAGGGDGSIVSLDPQTGRVRWRFDAGARVRSTPAVSAGFVVFGTMSGHVIALHERDGSLAWRYATTGAAHTFEEGGNDATSITASPTIEGARVFIGARDGHLYALDLQDGHLLWRTTHDESSWILSTASDGERLYVGSGSAQIVQAADLATGAEIWRSDTQAAVFSSITVSGDTLLFNDFAGNLRAIDRRSGAVRWQFAMGGRSLSTPVAVDGIVYCASDRGVLFALDAGSVAPAGAPRRIVYVEGKKTPKSFSWFPPGTEGAIVGHFVAAGYERMDAAQLEEFMRGYNGAPRSVVVMADNRIGSSPLIRRYLDSGGKIALLGPNPLAFVRDPDTDEVTGIDYAIPRRVFDVPYGELHEVGGYFASFPTTEGRRMGLRTPFVGYPALTPDGRTTALATNEYGKASAWLHSYGGPAGTGLLQLPVPRQDLPDLAEIQAAIEFGVMW